MKQLKENELAIVVLASDPAQALAKTPIHVTDRKSFFLALKPMVEANTNVIVIIPAETSILYAIEAVAQAWGISMFRIADVSYLRDEITGSDVNMHLIGYEPIDINTFTAWVGSSPTPDSMSVSSAAANALEGVDGAVDDSSRELEF